MSTPLLVSKTTFDFRHENQLQKINRTLARIFFCLLFIAATGVFGCAKVDEFQDNQQKLKEQQTQYQIELNRVTYKLDQLERVYDSIERKDAVIDSLLKIHNKKNL